MEYPNLPGAPIHEAVIDISTAPRAEFEGEELVQRVQAAFPEFEQTRKGVRLDVDFVKQEARQQLDRILLEAEGERLIVHARLDGFGVSKLKPYDSWETFKGRAVDLWGRYLEVVEPDRCTRLGLRYINHIELELDAPLTQLMKLFLAVPSQAAPLGFTALSTTYTTEFPESGATARVIFHLPPVPPEAASATAILDIDVFMGIDCAATDPKIWTDLDALAGVKNQIFFSSITDEAIRRFKEA